MTTEPPRSVLDVLESGTLQDLLPGRPDGLDDLGTPAPAGAGGLADRLDAAWLPPARTTAEKVKGSPGAGRRRWR